MEASYLILQILKNWWWFFLPIILFFPAKSLYMWWIQWNVWYKKNKWILLEIIPPKEILKPFKAMEDVIHILWGVYDGPNWRERWCEGELTDGPFWFSFEIASFGGDIHFYIRILEEWKNMFESAIHSQYPDAEISVVEDYVNKVPKDIPNKEWDLYAEDYTLFKDDIYPIRTYSLFFEKESEEKRVMEEKRLDPMNSLLEWMAKLEKSEQIWFQIVAAPITNNDNPWVTRGKAMVNKLAKRPEPKKQKPMIKEAIDILISGPSEETKEEAGLIAPELRLTPGEKEILQGIENKIAKQGFKTWIRMLYLYKINEPHSMANVKIIRNYLNHFMTQNLNGICYMGPTRVRIHYWLRKRRLYLRKRKQFRRYIERMPAYYPRSMRGEPPWFLKLIRYPLGPGIGRGTFILNAEELATIFHFPSKITLPAIPVIEAKKGGPPPGLPLE